MKMQELKNLAELMCEYQLTRLEVNPDGGVVMERKPAEAAMPIAERPAPSLAAAVSEKEEMPQGRLVKAPMVGVFYATSSPEAEPFVKPGDLVKKGDVLCIIEAMKLMNEISADVEGEVAEVMVQNGQLVEYGQPLFRIK